MNQKLSMAITKANKLIHQPSNHILLDFKGVKENLLTDLKQIENTITKAAIQAGANIIGIYFHHFDNNNGVTGVAILAESHISIHTWPELNFAAIDIFMCGDCKTDLAVDIIKQYFKPLDCSIRTIARCIK